MTFRRRATLNASLQSQALLVQWDALHETMHRAKGLADAISWMALGFESAGVEEGATLFAVSQTLSDQVQTLENELKTLRATFVPVRIATKPME